MLRIQQHPRERQRPGRGEGRNKVSEGVVNTVKCVLMYPYCMCTHLVCSMPGSGNRTIKNTSIHTEWRCCRKHFMLRCQEICKGKGQINCFNERHLDEIWAIINILTHYSPNCLKFKISIVCFSFFFWTASCRFSIQADFWWLIFWLFFALSWNLRMSSHRFLAFWWKTLKKNTRRYSVFSLTISVSRKASFFFFAWQR